MFNLSEKDIGRHVRQISTGKIDRVRKDPGNGWIYPGVMYEWECYRGDLEFVNIVVHKENPEGAVYDYLIWKPEHGLFYGPRCSGYVQNPERAGLYTKDFAVKYAESSRGVVKAYHIESQFVKKKLKDFEEDLIRRVVSAIEYLPSAQKFKILTTAAAKVESDRYEADRTYDE
jgi:hypothetical protein